ncbi:MAG: ribbon-helix-helix protein, CopG family [Promethearchaeota archaeon]
MSKTISTRLSEKEVAELEEIASKEKLDRSALIRSFVLHQLEEYKMKERANMYQKGIISLQEAATSANVSLYQMMDYVQREQIRPPTQTRAEFREEVSRSIKWLSR